MRWLVSGSVTVATVFVLLFVVIMGGGFALQQAKADCTVTGVGATPMPVDARQVAHVRTIIGVAKARGIPPRGWVVALAVALQESGLRNLANPAYPQSLPMTREGWGNNRDSLGLFQQRPTAGWGSVPQLMTPTYEATAFFGGHDLSQVNPGLLDIPGWEALPVTIAAQRVQASAAPDAYAKWEPEATQLAAANADAPPMDGLVHHPARLEMVQMAPIWRARAAVRVRQAMRPLSSPRRSSGWEPRTHGAGGPSTGPARGSVPALASSGSTAPATPGTPSCMARASPSRVRPRSSTRPRPAGWSNSVGPISPCSWQATSSSGAHQPASFTTSLSTSAPASCWRNRAPASLPSWSRCTAVTSSPPPARWSLRRPLSRHPGKANCDD